MTKAERGPQRVLVPSKEWTGCMAEPALQVMPDLPRFSAVPGVPLGGPRSVPKKQPCPRQNAPAAVALAGFVRKGKSGTSLALVAGFECVPY